MDEDERRRKEEERKRKEDKIRVRKGGKRRKEEKSRPEGEEKMEVEVTLCLGESSKAKPNRAKPCSINGSEATQDNLCQAKPCSA